MKEAVSVMSAANALSTSIQQQKQEVEGAVPASPPLRRGRSRVREISSRFMSPLVQVASTPKPESQRSKSVEKRQQRQEVEVDVACRNFIETARSLDSTTTNSTPFHHLQNHKSVPLKKPPPQQRGKLPCSFDKENNVRLEAKPELQHLPRSNNSSNSRVISRPDTPISSIPTTTGANRDKIVASRYRQTPHPRPTPAATSTPAAKLLQDATKSSDVDLPPQTQVHEAASLLVQDKISKSIIDPNHLCTTTSTSATPHHQGNRLRRSMSEVEHVLPNNRASPHSRSLSNSQNSSSWISLKGTDCDASTVTSSTSSTPNKISSPAVKNNQTGNFYQLPPHPENKARLGAPDAIKKPRKLLFNQQDDVNSFKLLYNHYLQWRFANARAEVSMLSQKMDAERQLYSLGAKISDMRDSVMKKRLELQMLHRVHSLSSIAVSQMPYLDEWSDMEENYSSSLSGVKEALQNLSLRLPVSGGVKVNVTELGEVLESAEKLSHSIVSNIESYTAKAEQVESLTSELARVASAEAAQLHDCGDSLLGVYASQVEECSLRGHIIQFCGHKNNSQPQQ